MEPKFKQVQNENSVISLSTGEFRLALLSTLLSKGITDDSYAMLDDLSSAISEMDKGDIELTQEFFATGVPAELLELGSTTWVKGKARIKFVIEFAPDSSDMPLESTLDEIRQMSVE
ncbi:KGK domain-containing protein [Thermosynechococcaceae cyanobacterium BACA0444]|uniref:KGK domain-containing protein n=1 Tax=Pseudocalidococcus azoricus BACA0444 TaxID=2918990 RepID=A0AAE4FSJ7_9CYAN|nr:KGK domain-containing protein [Pseudocalidococcus azoricus]MDS3860166.1 KGK domain-containing protein [Pseudocalidococcus azoricus BACA0444]